MYQVFYTFGITRTVNDVPHKLFVNNASMFTLKQYGKPRATKLPKRPPNISQLHHTTNVNNKKYKTLHTVALENNRHLHPSTFITHHFLCSLCASTWNVNVPTPTPFSCTKFRHITAQAAHPPVTHGPCTIALIQPLI